MTSVAAQAVPSELESDTRQFVTFYLDDGQFGVPLTDVQEIIRMPQLVKVPLAPSALLGLANLRGTVLPIASLRRAFALDEREADDSMRVVVVNRGTTMGVVVDRMSSVLTAEPSDIDSANHLRDVSRSDLVEKVVKHASGRVMVFDPIRVLQGVFDSGAELEDTPGGFRANERRLNSRAPEAEVAADERQLVSFEVQSQEYAFPIDRVKEIVTLPDEVTTIPRAPCSMVGVMVLRDRVLPLVSLRGLLGLDWRSETSQQRVVVTTGYTDADLSVGVVVDTVREVLRIAQNRVDEVPPLLRGGGEELEAVCRLDGGARIVTVLSVDALLDHEALRGELEETDLEDEDMQARRDRSAGDSVQVEDEEQLVIFRLREEEYGIPVEAVQEIVRVPEQMTAVPKAPPFVEGVINLRGEVLPVIDQRRRFDLESTERNDRQRIVVLKVRGQLLGFVVDSVAEVRKIPLSVIGPAPSMSEAQMKIIRRVANLGERGIILLLEPEQMISPEEGESLEDLN